MVGGRLGLQPPAGASATKSLRAGLLPSKAQEDIHMRKLTAIIAALGFLASTSLTPVFAAPAVDTAVKNDDLSTAGKKKKKKKGAEVITTQDEMTTAGKKKKKKKGAEIILYRVAA
jgi:hypothetical protein